MHLLRFPLLLSNCSGSSELTFDTSSQEDCSVLFELHIDWTVSSGEMLYKIPYFFHGLNPFRLYLLWTFSSAIS